MNDFRAHVGKSRTISALAPKVEQGTFVCHVCNKSYHDNQAYLTHCQRPSHLRRVGKATSVQRSDRSAVQALLQSARPVGSKPEAKKLTSMEDLEERIRGREEDERVAKRARREEKRERKRARIDAMLRGEEGEEKAEEKAGGDVEAAGKGKDAVEAAATEAKKEETAEETAEATADAAAEIDPEVKAQQDMMRAMGLPVSF